MQVLVELVPDTSRVETSIEQLNKKGQITDAAAEAYQKGNAELQKRNTLLDTAAKNTNKLTDSQKKQIPTINAIEKAISSMVDEFMIGVGEGMKQAAEEAGISVEALMERIRQATNNTNQQVDAEESLRKKLSEIKAEIALLIATEDIWTEKERKRFDDLVAQAGKYQDAISDAAQEINNAGSDTKNLDNLIDLTQGAASGFAVLQGASALFGVQSEELQQTLVKLNAVMIISQGLQQIQDLLSKKYIQNLITINRAQLINNAQIAIENGLQSQSVIVRGLATAAQWALNVAMSANPIGLIITSLAAAIVLLKNYADAARDTAEEQARLNQEIENGTSGLNAELEIYDRNLKKRLADLDAAGGKQSEMNNAELATLRLKGNAISAQLVNLRRVISESQKLNMDTKAASDLEIKLTKELDDINTEAYIKKRQQEKNIRDEKKQTADEEKKHQEELEAKAKEAREKALKALKNEMDDRRALAEITLLYVEANTEEELQARIDLINKTRDAELANAELTANQRALIYAKANEDIRKLQEQFNKDQVKTAAQVEVIIAESKVASYKEGTNEYYAAQREFLLTQADLARLEIEQSTQSEQLKAASILRINAKLNQDVEALRKAQFEQEITARHESITRIEQLEVAGLIRQSNDLTLNQNRRFKALQASRLGELKIIEDNQVKLNELALAGVISNEEYEKQKTALKEQEAEKRFEIAQAYAAKEKDLRKALADFALNAITDVVNTSAQIEQANRQAQLDAELDRIETEKQSALDNKNLTESQKVQIEKRYSAEAKKLKNDAARKERQAQINQAIALGILSAIRSLAEYPWPYNLIALAANAVTTGLQITQLNSTPLPQYYTGTKSAKKGWAWVGEQGPELVRLQGGERILNARESSKVGKAWASGDMSDPDRILAGRTPNPHNQALSDYKVSSGGSIELDYDKMGKSMAKHIPAPSMTMTADGDGFSMYVNNKNYKAKILNEKYSI